MIVNPLTSHVEMQQGIGHRATSEKLLTPLICTATNATVQLHCHTNSHAPTPCHWSSTVSPLTALADFCIVKQYKNECLFHDRRKNDIHALPCDASGNDGRRTVSLGIAGIFLRNLPRSSSSFLLSLWGGGRLDLRGGRDFMNGPNVVCDVVSLAECVTGRTYGEGVLLLGKTTSTTFDWMPPSAASPVVGRLDEPAIPSCSNTGMA